MAAWASASLLISTNPNPLLRPAPSPRASGPTTAAQLLSWRSASADDEGKIIRNMQMLAVIHAHADEQFRTGNSFERTI